MLKKIIIAVAILVVTGGGYGLYMYFMPHRDVQSIEAFATVSSTDLINEFLEQKEEANKKYLAEDGDSKVIIVTGNVQSIEVDQKKQKVVLLKEENSNLGVSCTFMLETNENADLLQKGDFVRIKGVIRSGAEYDEDLDLYEDVIIENCDIATR